MNMGGINCKNSTSRWIAQKGPGNEVNEQYEHLKSTSAISEADSYLSGTSLYQGSCERDESRLQPGSTEKAVNLPTKSTKLT